MILNRFKLLLNFKKNYICYLQKQIEEFHLLQELNGKKEYEWFFILRDFIDHTLLNNIDDHGFKRELIKPDEIAALHKIWSLAVNNPDTDIRTKIDISLIVIKILECISCGFQYEQAVKRVVLTDPYKKHLLGLKI
jgi:hypothetical protein